PPPPPWVGRETRRPLEATIPVKPLRVCVNSVPIRCRRRTEARPGPQPELRDGAGGDELAHRLEVLRDRVVFAAERDELANPLVRAARRRAEPRPAAEIHGLRRQDESDRDDPLAQS